MCVTPKTKQKTSKDTIGSVPNTLGIRFIQVLRGVIIVEPTAFFSFDNKITKVNKETVVRDCKIEAKHGRTGYFSFPHKSKPKQKRIQ